MFDVNKSIDTVVDGVLSDIQSADVWHEGERVAMLSALLFVIEYRLVEISGVESALAYLTNTAVDFEEEDCDLFPKVKETRAYDLCARAGLFLEERLEEYHQVVRRGTDENWLSIFGSMIGLVIERLATELSEHDCDTLLKEHSKRVRMFPEVIDVLDQSWGPEKAAERLM